MTTGRARAAMLCEEWDLLIDLCESLDDEQWRAATDCPGWNVKDVISHLVGVERTLAGHPSPEHEARAKSHVRNPIGERNEIEVDWRRRHSPSEVLEEFRAVIAERARTLQAMEEGDFDEPTWTPVGPGTVADFMSLRILDTWVHEQDIRRAVGERGHLAGPIAEHVFERLTRGLPKVVGKDAGAPEGAVVAFGVQGTERSSRRSRKQTERSSRRSRKQTERSSRRSRKQTESDLAIGVSDGRARMLESIPAEADVRLVMDLQTFVCLTCGRWDPALTLRSGLAAIEGDQDLGTRIVSNLNILF